MEVDKKAVLEGLLFVVGDDGLTIHQIIDILEIDLEEAKIIIKSLFDDYQQNNRGIRISFLGNTFKLTTKKEHHQFYEKLLTNEENNTLSNSSLETLAIIAYNEPITRVEVDEIRGVQTGQLIRKLVAKGLIKEDGRSTLPGRPILYKTTSDFLDYFGLNSISELPNVEVLKEKKDDVSLYETKYTEGSI